MPFQVWLILPLIAVTALKAGWLLSRIFLAALREPPSASNGCAASARCSAVRDFLVPNHVKLTRTAAEWARRSRAGVWLFVVAIWFCSRTALIENSMVMVISVACLTPRRVEGGISPR